MNFYVEGKIQGKARPRFTRKGHTYTDPKTKAYEARIATLYRAYGGDDLFGDPVKVFIEARFQPSKQTSKSKLKQMLERILFPLKRPDVDNIAKIVMDALNGIAYDDDKQVVDLHARKVYAENEGVFVWVDCYD